MRGSSWLTLIVVIFVVFLTAGTAVFAYTTARKFAAESPVELPPLPQFNSVNPTATPVPSTALPTSAPTQNSSGASVATSAIGIAPTTTALPGWADPARVTILLMGIDQRKGETGEFNTDTMMVISLDPIRKTIAMLSIPRDTYIKIPTSGTDRINRAFAIGDSTNFPGGGGALAIKTVQSLVGIPIQHYVLINFDVFTTAIDAVGPIQVCPDTPIHDDQYPDGSYGYITVDFKAGCQLLDATKLLEYSRVRHNAGDDFGRASRQQEVIKAVREKVLSLGGVYALASKTNDLWNSVKDNVKTDLTLNDIIALALTAQTVDKGNIHSAVLTDSQNYLLPSTLPDGSQILSPNYEKIHDLVTTLFDTAPGSNSPAAAEGATIQVSNGTATQGLGQTIADTLTQAGFNVINIGNADNANHAKTVINVYNGKVKTAQLLATTLSLDSTTINAAAQNGPPGVDIEVIIGKDLATSGQ